MNATILTCNNFFQICGHNKGRYYFFSECIEDFLDFSAHDLEHIGSVLELAPLHYWEKHYGDISEGSESHINIIDVLIRESYKRGLFDDSQTSEDHKLERLF